MIDQFPNVAMLSRDALGQEIKVLENPSLVFLGEFQFPAVHPQTPPLPLIKKLKRKKVRKTE